MKLRLLAHLQLQNKRAKKQLALMKQKRIDKCFFRKKNR